LGFVIEDSVDEIGAGNRHPDVRLNREGARHPTERKKSEKLFFEGARDPIVSAKLLMSHIQLFMKGRTSFSAH